MTETAQPLLTWTSLGTITSMALVVSGAVGIIATAIGLARTPDKDPTREDEKLKKIRLVLLLFAGIVSCGLALGYLLIDTPAMSTPKLVTLVIVNSIAVFAAATGANEILASGQAALKATAKGQGTPARVSSATFEALDAEGKNAVINSALSPEPPRTFFQSWMHE